MERSTILKLNQLNHSFYTTVAKDFDQTRQSAWAGWSELLHFLASISISMTTQLCVLSGARLNMTLFTQTLSVPQGECSVNHVRVVSNFIGR